MARLRFGIVVFCILFLSGCSQVQGKLLVMDGNIRLSRSRYDGAIASYMEALAFSESLPYAQLGLGTVYIHLGELDAAMQRFNAAEDALNTMAEKAPGELWYRLQYNRGIVSFQNRDYGAAADYFRRALEADSGRIEAKRNLEISLLLLSREEMNAASTAPLTLISGSSTGNTLFEYLRQKEQDQWKSREWTEETESAGPDY